MAIGELVTVRKDRECSLYRADATLALQLPGLRLPRMDDEARPAFRAILAYEQPPSNGSLTDILRLAEARGYCAHPADWVPNFEDDPHEIALYQPWVDWLSENGLTPFHRGNRLTQENWRQWTPSSLSAAFNRVFEANPQLALELLTAMATKTPAATRRKLLETIGPRGQYSGVSLRQFEVVAYFLADPLEKIRAAAAVFLDKSRVLEAKTKEAYAEELAERIAVSDDCVKYKTSPEPSNKYPLDQAYRGTTCDALAMAMGLSAQELARRCDFEELGPSFMGMVTRTGDVETRSILAARVLDREKDFHFALFKGLARPLCERGLRTTFKSHYWSEVGDFLGLEAGTLNASAMRELKCYGNLDLSVTRELEEGKLPVNRQYDALRALALVVDKDAARSVLERALSLGMKEDNPRLTMLKFNMAL